MRPPISGIERKLTTFIRRERSARAWSTGDDQPATLAAPVSKSADNEVSRFLEAHPQHESHRSELLRLRRRRLDECRERSERTKLA